MGIWGAAAEENDDAYDWLADFVLSPNIVELNDVFDEVLASGDEDYIEIDVGCRGIAAAEIVSDLFGTKRSKPIVEFEDDEIREAVSKLTHHARVALLERAIVATKTVAFDEDRSELCQVWFEQPSQAKPWIANVNLLVTRLSAVLSSLN